MVVPSVAKPVSLLSEYLDHFDQSPPAFSRSQPVQMSSRRSLELLNSLVLLQAHPLHLCYTLLTNPYKYIFIIINICKQIEQTIPAMEIIKRSDSEVSGGLHHLASQLN